MDSYTQVLEINDRVLNQNNLSTMHSLAGSKLMEPRIKLIHNQAHMHFFLVDSAMQSIFSL